MKSRLKVGSILYVEDEKSIQDELADVIEFFCSKLYVAQNGQEGLELYKKHTPDIVITDISMPQMDGIVMSKEIKKLKEDVHIIFTTALSDTEYFQEAIDLQVEGYILKPIDLNLLEKKVLSVIKNIELKKEEHILQEAKLTAMREMLSSIAHQWRQPLNVVNGVLYNLSDAYAYNELTKEYFDEMLSIANTNIEFMSKTIDDFKNFSKPSEKSEFYFHEIATSINAILLAQLSSKNIKLSFIADEELTLFGSKNELSHTLLNLINNARDAIVSDGVSNGLISIEAHKHNNKTSIRIKDNAHGIAKELQNRIFDPYFTTKEEGQGTGIGLYISNQTLQRSFNASLSLEKSDEEGTIFLITIS